MAERGRARGQREYERMLNVQLGLQKCRCFYCPSPLTRSRRARKWDYARERAADVRAATVDHLVPFSLGGATDPDNIVLACLPCNMTKGDRPPSLAAILKLVGMMHPGCLLVDDLDPRLAPAGAPSLQALALRGAITIKA